MPAVRQIFTLALVYRRAKEMLDVNFPLRHVGLTIAPPAEPKLREALLETFRAPVEYGTDHPELVFDEKLWSRPTRLARPPLLKVLEEHAAVLLARVPQGEGLEHDLRRELLRQLAGGSPTAPAVARGLGLSVRTLQRKLKEHGVSFQDVLDELRGEVALRYLRDPSLSIAEVGHLLGYSEPSSFTRAFKRWSGETPKEFREGGD
jgi:AraC-like DNA-binding protein